MSAVKIKILENTNANQTLVSVDGRPAYDTGNSADKEKRNLQALFNKMVIENVTIETKQV